MLETQRTSQTAGEATPIPRTSAPALEKIGWLEERLQLTALQAEYGRKAFPVHSTFFLGEMAAINFLILVLTGIYLGLLSTRHQSPRSPSAARSYPRRSLACSSSNRSLLPISSATFITGQRAS